MSFDELPPDVSDLIVEQIAIPDEENGMVLLTKVAGDTQKAFTAASIDTSELSIFVERVVWDDKQAQIWTTHFEPFWERYQAAAAKPRSFDRRQTSLKADPLVYPQLYLLNELAILRARKLLNEGDANAAIETALVSLRTGTRLLNSQGRLRTYLPGCWFQVVSLGMIQDAVRHPNVSKSALHSILAEIKAARVDSRVLEGAMREERYFFELQQAAIATSGLQKDQVPFMQPTIARLLTEIPLFYKPNKTARLYTQHLRNSIALIQSDYSAQRAETGKFQNKVFPPSLMRFWPDNFMGNVILMSSTPTWGAAISQFMRTQTKLSASEVFVAARLYQLEHGALPSNLDLLVPDYLPAVPHEYPTSSPIRYSAELGVVWVAGSNALDITSADQPINDREVVLWFVDRAPPPRQLNPIEEEEKPTDSKTSDSATALATSAATTHEPVAPTAAPAP